MIRSISSKWNSVPWVCVTLLTLWRAPAAAVDFGEHTQVHGFVSQSLVHTTDNRVGGGSDDGVGMDLRELGLNVSWRPDPDWMLSAQALSRWAGKPDEGGLRLDYGFLNRTLFADGASHLGLRVGKIKNPLGFYNTTRDVAHTRPGAAMPQSIYLDRVRNFYLAAPGVSLYGLNTLERWEVNWSLNGFVPVADDVDLENLLLGADWPGHLEGETSWLGQLMFDLNGGRWRLGVSAGNVGVRYQRAGVADPALAGQSDLNTWTVSAQKNTSDWSLTAEYSQTHNQGQGYGSVPGLPLAQRGNTVEAWYVQGTWRITPTWAAHLRRDVLYIDKDDQDGSRFYQLSLDPLNSPIPLPPHMMFGKGWTLGLRHDMGNWSIWGEWSRVSGTAWLSPQDTPLLAQQKNWDMLHLQAAWRF